jgi:predicted XRE-type DNA-binding protein
MGDDLDLVRGTDSPFLDVGLPAPDTKRMKADLAAEIIRILRERGLTGAAAARLAGVQEADVSRIRNADLARFTIDRLVKILNHLDRRVEVHVTFRPAATTGGPAPALRPE